LKTTSTNWGRHGGVKGGGEYAKNDPYIPGSKQQSENYLLCLVGGNQGTLGLNCRLAQEVKQNIEAKGETEEKE